MQVFLTASEIENNLLNLSMILILMLWLCEACEPSYFCILDVLNYLLSTVYKTCILVIMLLKELSWVKTRYMLLTGSVASG